MTISQITRIPLSLKGWLRMGNEDPAALERSTAYLKAHEFLDPGEELSDRAVMLRVAIMLERLLLDGLKGARYTVVDELRPLREGECSFVNGHLELYCQKALYPHSVFVRFVDGSTGAAVYPGKSGRLGWTLPAIQRHLAEELGVEDALLLDNGGDVRLWFRGCAVVRSSERRPEIRAMLGLVASGAASHCDAISVS